LRVSRRKLKAREPKVTLQIGKSGLSEGFLRELDRQLDEVGLVKVRFLRSARLLYEHKDQLLQDLLSKVRDAELVDFRGFTVTLYRSREKRRRKTLYRNST